MLRYRISARNPSVIILALEFSHTPGYSSFAQKPLLSTFPGVSIYSLTKAFTETSGLPNFPRPAKVSGQSRCFTPTANLIIFADTRSRNYVFMNSNTLWGNFHLSHLKLIYLCKRGKKETIESGTFRGNNQGLSIRKKLKDSDKGKEVN